MWFKDPIPARHREFLAFLLVLMFCLVLRVPAIVYLVVAILFLLCRDWFYYD